MEQTFTELEKQYLAESGIDETGIIDDSGVNMDSKIMRGVISSLIKKGVMESSGEHPFGHPEITWMIPCDRSIFGFDYEG